jgi:hypothetical protein
VARFDSAIALADRLITRNGETATIRRPVDGTPPDADKPWEPGVSTNDDHETAAVFLDHETARSLGVLLKAGQQAVLVPASDLGTFVPDPSTDILLRASGTKWTIVKVTTLSPNGQLIMHTLTVEN